MFKSTPELQWQQQQQTTRNRDGVPRHGTVQRDTALARRERILLETQGGEVTPATAPLTSSPTQWAAGEERSGEERRGGWGEEAVDALQRGWGEERRGREEARR